MTAQPACYLRRSYVDANAPGDISRDAQLAAVRKLAAADGHNGDLVEYDDWGISADVAKASKRTAYTRLLGDMEDGKVSALYAFDVDRLYRDPRDLIRLQDAATAHGVRIVTTGGPLAIGEGDDPAAEAFAFVGSIFARLELQKAKKRARAAREARRERGDRFGHAPYGFRHVKDETGRIVRVPDPAEPLAPVLDAYREARTVLGACKLLKDRHIRSPKGKEIWWPSVLTRVLDENAPELRTRYGRRGRPVSRPAPLAGLLRCHCGMTLTPNLERGQYYCARGTRDGAAVHGKTIATTKIIMPWIEAEAGRLRTPERVSLGVEDRGEAIAARLDRAHELYIAGDIDRPRYDAEKARATADLAALDAAQAIMDVPAIDWSWPPAELNAVLRALWSEIRLDDRMAPVEAVWTVPEWRAD